MRDESPIAHESDWIVLKPKDKLTKHFDKLVSQAEKLAKKYGLEDEDVLYKVTQ